MSKVHKSDYWYMSAFDEEKEGITTNYGNSYNADILTTGASKQTEVYHIYDLAGNVWEWTEETSMTQITEQYRIFRGGSGLDGAAIIPACYRSGYHKTNETLCNIGFREVLYMR